MNIIMSTTLPISESSYMKRWLDVNMGVSNSVINDILLPCHSAFTTIQWNLRITDTLGAGPACVHCSEVVLISEGAIELYFAAYINHFEYCLL